MSHKRRLLVDSTDKDMDKVLQSVSVKVERSVKKVNAIHKARLVEISKKQKSRARASVNA